MGARKETGIDLSRDEQDLALADTSVTKPDESTTTVSLDNEMEDTGFFEVETEASDNVGMSSVQFDVDQLISEVEAEANEGVDQSGRLRRRLDALRERKRRHEALMDFDDYDLDS